MNRNRYILSFCLVFVALSLALFLYARREQSEKHQTLVQSEAQPQSETMTQTAASSLIKLYTSKSKGFTLNYGGDMKVDEAYTYNNLQSGKSIAGVSFAFAPEYYQGTNLSSDSHVAVEWQNVSTCAPKEFTDEPLQNVEVRSINGNKWSVASTSGAGAGNLYEELLYTRKGTSDCYNVRLFLHSANIGNYEAGTVKEFDRRDVMQVFTLILSSFKDNATSTTHLP